MRTLFVCVYQNKYLSTIARTHMQYLFFFVTACKPALIKHLEKKVNRCDKVKKSYFFLHKQYNIIGIYDYEFVLLYIFKYLKCSPLN